MEANSARQKRRLEAISPHIIRLIMSFFADRAVMAAPEEVLRASRLPEKTLQALYKDFPRAVLGPGHSRVGCGRL